MLNKINLLLSQVLSILIFFTFSLADAKGGEIFVLTYNVWGLGTTHELPLPFASKEIGARMTKICHALRKGSWDVVLLQEIWRARDRHLMTDCGYKYYLSLDTPHIMDQGGAWSKLGSGLMILSKFPMSRPTHVLFEENGEWSHVLDGELVAQKSAIFAVVHHRDGDVTIGNIHTVSNYLDHDYPDQRRKQVKIAAETGWEITQKYSHGRMIMGGDFNFNSNPESRAFSDLSTKIPDLYLPGFSSSHSSETEESEENPFTSSNLNAWNKKEGGAGNVDDLWSSPNLTVVADFPKIPFGHKKHIDDAIITSDFGLPGKVGLAPLSDHFPLQRKYTFD